MKGKYFILGLSILSSGAMAANLDLTLKDAVNLAIERNEQVQITNYQLEEAKKTLKKAYSGLFPTIALQAKAVKTTQNPTLFGSGGPSIMSENYQQIGSISLSQPVYTFGRLSGAIDAAKGQDKLAHNSSTATIASIKTTAKTIFYNTLFYKKTLEISQESYDNALSNQRALKKRVSYGRISQDENLKMKADIASRKPSLLEAKRLYDSSVIELKNFLNIPEETDVNISGNLLVQGRRTNKESKIQLSDLVQVHLLKNQFEIQEAIQDVTSASYLPTLSLFASYGKSAYFNDFQGDHFIDQENVGFGLSLDMSFDLGGGTTYDMQISKIRTKIKHLELEQGKRQIKLALKNLYEQYARLQEKRDALKEAVSLAQSSYKVALNSFANGTVSQTQLNDRELLLTNNKIAFAQSLLQLQLVNFEIEKMETTK